MSQQPTNYDAIRDMLERAYRPLETKDRRKLERVKDYVDALPPDRLQAVYEQLKDATDAERREWVDIAAD